MIVEKDTINTKYEIDISNLDIVTIKNKLSNLIDTFSWTMPKDYILDSIERELDKHVNNKLENKEIVVKSVSFTKKKKVTTTNVQLSLFD